MRLQSQSCPARLSDDNTTLCELQVTPPLPFCAHHYREYCTLKEKERGAGREGDALKEMVDRRAADAIDTYTTLREVQSAREVAELYGGALERQAEVVNVLRVRFASNDAAPPSLTDLEARWDGARALVQKLADRERVLAVEDKARSAAAELRSVLGVPHKPFSCDEGSANTVSDSRERQCPAIKLTSQRCTATLCAGKRLCMLHVVTHASISVVVRMLWKDMETARVEVARIEVGTGSLSTNTKAAKAYISKVNDCVEEVQRHQETYSCRAPADHEALVAGLRKRMIAAMLLLGELRGSEEYQTALRQGHAEAWASENLSKVLKGDNLVGEVATGAVVGAGLCAVFGGPIGIGAFAGGALLWARSAAGKEKLV